MLTEADASRAMNNKRIFVVESDEVIRHALEFILESGNETHVLAGLEQAYTAGQRWKPDLVLLGLSAVRDRGILVLDEIAVRLPDAKILLVAESRNDPLALLCLAIGADGVLGQPITYDSVCDKVDLLLERKKPSRPFLDTLATSRKSLS